jgi:hypothetical protein
MYLRHKYFSESLCWDYSLSEILLHSWTLNIDSSVIETGRFICYKSKFILLLNLSMKLSIRNTVLINIMFGSRLFSVMDGYPWRIVMSFTQNHLHRLLLLFISVLRTLRTMRVRRQRKTWEKFCFTEFACSSTMVHRNVSAMLHALHLGSSCIITDTPWTGRFSENVRLYVYIYTHLGN